MEKIVVISCCKFSISFKKKFITIREGETVTLRRALRGEAAAKNNGLFDYPKHIKECKLSRNHADIGYNDSKVYLRAINPNTFINKRRVTPGEGGSVLESGDTIFLGGSSQNMYESVIGLVTIFSPTDENYKYFCLLETEYPFFCLLPESPPMLSIKTEDLFSVTMNRLEVLKHLSVFGENELNSHKTIKMATETLKTKCYADLLREEAFYSDPKNRYEFMRNDHISLFVLTVAFSRNKRLKYWFIDQERKLFILRWFKMFPQEQVDFLAKYNIYYEEVPHSEVTALSHCNVFLDSMRYFKVHFTKSPILIKRHVFIQNGFCYLRIEDMYAPVVEHLRKLLLNMFKPFHANLHRIWWDSRIRSIIIYVQRKVLTTDRYKSKGELVTEKNIHQLCDESFPLCMKILQFHLSRDHHLRNGGRFQYTLFLKGIGLSMSSCLAFMKSHFTKKIEENVFMKRYSYHIRHAYGTEGKMADYSPQSCADILKAVPGPLEYHGCPFKVLDTIRMKEALHRSGIDRKDYTDILECIQKGAPQEACRIYFELMHGEKYLRSSVVHPNEYYDESRKVRLRQREKIQVEFDDGKNTVGRGDRAVELINCQSTSNW